MNDRDRTVTYPLGAVTSVANQLCDWDWNLPMDEAQDRALTIVLDVVSHVDKLREAEAA